MSRPLQSKSLDHASDQRLLNEPSDLSADFQSPLYRIPLRSQNPTQGPFLNTNNLFLARTVKFQVSQP